MFFGLGASCQVFHKDLALPSAIFVYRQGFIGDKNSAMLCFFVAFFGLIILLLLFMIVVKW